MEVKECVVDLDKRSIEKTALFQKKDIDLAGQSVPRTYSCK